MITDPIPRSYALRWYYQRSDEITDLPLPEDDRLVVCARQIEAALQTGHTGPVRAACAAFLERASEFYKVPTPTVRVLAARPLIVWESGGVAELFGDYDPSKKLIRLWMRTAMRKQVTSFGTFLSTLCHEFCHHLDRELFRLPPTYHTRGFYERTAALYHHCRQTPRKRLYWKMLPSGRFVIDWVKTRAGNPPDAGG